MCSCSAANARRATARRASDRGRCKPHLRTPPVPVTAGAIRGAGAACTTSRCERERRCVDGRTSYDRFDGVVVQNAPCGQKRAFAAVLALSYSDAYKPCPLQDACTYLRRRAACSHGARFSCARRERSAPCESLLGSPAVGVAAVSACRRPPCVRLPCAQWLQGMSPPQGFHPTSWSRRAAASPFSPGAYRSRYTASSSASSSRFLVRSAYAELGHGGRAGACQRAVPSCAALLTVHRLVGYPR